MKRSQAMAVGLLLFAIVGCGGPSTDERENRKAFERLLSAISLKNVKELERDAQAIEVRRKEGVLSEPRYADLLEIIGKARQGQWEAAENAAYAFREKRPYFR